MTKTFTVTAYLVIEPSYSPYGNNQLNGFKITQLKQRPPKEGFYVEVELEIEESFMPKIQAKVDIPQPAVSPKKIRAVSKGGPRKMIRRG